MNEPKSGYGGCARRVGAKGTGVLRALVALAGGLLLFIACASPSEEARGKSEGGEAVDRESAPTTYEEFQREFEEIRCAHEERCNDRPVSDCRLYTLQDLGLDRAELDYDPTLASGCLSALRDAACADYDKITYTHCMDVAQGRGGDNEPCSQREDCKAAFYCDNFGSCPGRCLPLGKVGEECPYHQCEIDGYCNAGVCAARLQEGGDCSSAECEVWLTCIDGTCLAEEPFTRQVGDACGIDAYCDPLAYCNPTTNKCETAKAVGEPCNPVSCQGGHFCNDDGVCQPDLEDGQPCTSFVQCEGGVCMDGSCRQMSVVGEPCVNYWDCLSLECGESGKCLPFGGCE